MGILQDLISSGLNLIRAGLKLCYLCNTFGFRHLRPNTAELFLCHLSDRIWGLIFGCPWARPQPAASESSELPLVAR